MWTVYGKVKKIVKYSPLDTTASDSIVFEYDPLGNRLEKRNYIHQLPLCHTCLATPITDTVKYIRDASGNIMAIYDRKKDTVRFTEFDLYGSKRIGVLDTVMRMKKPIVGYGPMDSLRISYLEGQRQYELTNHLGNVLVTVDDRKLPIDTTSTPNVENYYVANVVNSQDYYPFGMIEPGRQFAILADSSYGYGYQGSMKDNNIYGKNNAYATKNRELDDRAGRWWSIDPKSTAWESPYVSMGDNPVWHNDPYGSSVEPGTTKDKAQFDKLIDDKFADVKNEKGKIIQNNSKLRALFKNSYDANSNQYKNIDDGKFKNAIKGLSKEDQAIAIGLKTVINSVGIVGFFTYEVHSFPPLFNETSQFRNGVYNKDYQDRVGDPQKGVGPIGWYPNQDNSYNVLSSLENPYAGIVIAKSYADDPAFQQKQISNMPKYENEILGNFLYAAASLFSQTTPDPKEQIFIQNVKNGKPTDEKDIPDFNKYK